MHKKLLGFGLGLALLTGSTAAWAGGKGYSPVYISVLSRYATGSMGDARNSTDTLQGISITFDASSNSEFAYVNISDSTGLWAFCSTSSSTMISAMKAVNSDARVTVSWDQNGVCTSFTVDNSSWSSPKLP
ncbi:hypothetical protein [Corallococcus exiguus]|uniref:Uncharacterized protein n=1 Tax=Corallococcus exiguus TaxID=83462 RepID=A0A7X5BRW1_9BACT|nr:hypothetical protein [Corallococcus exiguus]NBC39553.1 hypothetical protein [Corallococcus exiguus]TNV67592.1 hypothetical protein FH620_00140 [Corallococcus exiguus]